MLNPAIAFRGVRLLSLAAGCLTALGASMAAADECSDLRSVARYAVQEFQPVIDKAVSATQWSSKATIEGWPLCQIERGKATTFACISQTVKSRQAAKNLLEARIKSIQSCLGPGWQRNDNFGISGLMNFSVDFSVNLAVFPPEMGADRPNQDYHVRLSVYSLQTIKPDADTVRAATGPKVVPQQFCPDLQKVIEAAPKSFDALLGKTRGSGWSAKIQLTDWNDCRISELEKGKANTRYYSCELPPHNKVADAEALFGKLETTVGGCLGDAWSRRRRVSDGLPKTYFEKNNGDPTVELRIRKDSTDGTWEVKLDVNLD